MIFIGCLVCLLPGGCFDPDYGVVSFRCDKDDLCPEGYTCTPTPGGKFCIRTGVTLDFAVDAPRTDGPRLDKAAPDLKPGDLKKGDGPASDRPRDMPGKDLAKDLAKDLKPVPDKVADKTLTPDKKPDSAWPKDGPLPDVKPKPDLAPPPDQKPSPDLPAGPTVVLSTPAQNTTTSAVTVNLTYYAYGFPTNTSCDLILDGAKTLTQAYPVTGSGLFKVTTLADGPHAWEVWCLDGAGKTVKSQSFSFTVKSIEITGCQNGGFVTGNRYLIKTAIQATGTGDCLVIDAGQVLVDGKNNPIRSGGGYKDILYDRGQVENLTLLENSGGTTFNATAISTIAQTALSENSTVGDFNNDGILDYVTHSTDVTNGGVRVYKGIGSGKIDTATVYHLTAGAYSAALPMDFNLDGYLDLMAAGFNTTEAFIKGSGSGLLAAYDLDLGTWSTGLVLGNFEGSNDASPDMLVTNASIGGKNDCPQIGLNKLSAGTASITVAWNGTTSTACGGRSPFVADFNKDGIWDLLVTEAPSTAARKARLLQGDGTGSTFTVKLTSIGYEALGVADMDQDGDTDALLYGSPVTVGTTPGFSTYSVYENGSTPSTGWVFAHKAAYTVPQNIAEAWPLDMNGDSYPDLVMRTLSDQNAIAVHLLQGTSGTPSGVWASTAPQALAKQLLVRDLDLDGHLDLIGSLHASASGGTAYLYTYTNNGTGTNFSISYTRSASGTDAYRMASPGDFSGTKARGIYLQSGSNQVTLKNIGPIRGYDIGVEVAAGNADLDGITVEDPELYGVFINGAALVTVKNVTVKHLFQGTGIAVINANKAQLDNNTVCPVGPFAGQAPLSMLCRGSAVYGSNNAMKLNNGCGNFTAYKSCR